MLSISDFSEMSHLPPQTLRYYHAEGLLVPAGVDERTGYRSYAFEQVEQAMLVTVLRETGMSVKLVRQALDEPDRAPALLRQHEADAARERLAQEQAIKAAWGLFEAQPEATLKQVPALTVVTLPVPGTPPGRDAREWDAAEEIVAAATAELVTAIEAGGATVTGTPWRALPLETPEQERALFEGRGVNWLVKVPVAGPVALPCTELAAHEEVSVFLPGRTSMAKYCTAIVRLYAYPLAESFANTARLRLTVHADGFELSAPVTPFQDEATADRWDKVEAVYREES